MNRALIPIAAALILAGMSAPPAPAQNDSGASKPPKLEYRPLAEDVDRLEDPLEANAILNTTMQVLDFRDAELQDVIRLIAAKSGLNIIMSPEGVDGKVTLHLENVRLGVALNNILRINNLAYVVSEEENIVRIVDAATVGIKEVETSTELIQINWVNADDLVEVLGTFVSDDGSIVANAETNAVIVTDTPPSIAVIKDLIKKIDIPERQVLIEARLVDMIEGAIQNFGASVNIERDDRDELSPLGSFFDPTNPVDGIASNLPAQLGGEGITWAFGENVTIFGEGFQLNAELEALERREMVELLSNPKVMTINNIPARIKIVEQIPYTESVTGVSGATTLEVEFEEAGIEINVTPIITPNGFIRMNIETVQSIFRGRVGSGELDPPQLDDREANTNVIVPSGNTVALGGLREYRHLDNTRGVPWLHQVPVIGWFFKSKTNDQSKKELYLFVTPRIIESEDITPEISDPNLTSTEKAWYDRIDTKWHLPDYFFDDIKTDNDEW